MYWQKIMYLIVFQPIFVQAQYINNLGFSQEEQKIIMTFDLKPTTQNQYYKIWAKFSQAGGSTYLPKIVTGDYGEPVSGGSGKKFVWNALLENLNALEGEFTITLYADLYGTVIGSKNMVFIEGGTLEMGDTFNEGVIQIVAPSH